MSEQKVETIQRRGRGIQRPPELKLKAIKKALEAVAKRAEEGSEEDQRVLLQIPAAANAIASPIVAVERPRGGLLGTLWDDDK